MFFLGHNFIRLFVFLILIASALLFLNNLVLATEKFSMKIPSGGYPMTMKLFSSVFSDKGSIPVVYTCDGEDISPPLDWTGLPAETKSLALIVDDPDAPDPKAPKMTWVHWILYNIPPQANGLPEKIARQDLAPGTKEGLNDWKRKGYGGPCPPIGRHRYFFKLYAIDILLPDLGLPTKSQLLKVLEGHVLEEAELIGTYKRR
jgi:Raf kinase inhibitor-like YbhB/YbcL family protein